MCQFAGLLGHQDANLVEYFFERRDFRLLNEAGLGSDAVQLVVLRQQRAGKQHGFANQLRLEMVQSFDFMPTGENFRPVAAQEIMPDISASDIETQRKELARWARYPE